MERIVDTSPLEKEDWIGNYSDLFPNSQVPSPSQNDGRPRNINHASKLPEIFDQGNLGCCVSATLATVKEYQESLETDRIEKKSTHYLHDLRLRKTNCVLRTPIGTESDFIEVPIGDDGAIETKYMKHVVEIEYELKPGLVTESAIGIPQIGLGVSRDKGDFYQNKYAKYGRLNIGGENFVVVNNKSVDILLLILVSVIMI